MLDGFQAGGSGKAGCGGSGHEGIEHFLLISELEELERLFCWTLKTAMWM